MLSKAVEKLLNRSPGEIMVEQLKKLYLRLYPYVIQDFVHKEDVNAALQAVSADLMTLRLAILKHTHTPTGNAVAVIPPVPIGVIATDANGFKYIAFPPESGDIVAVRRDPDPVVIPAINPLDPL